MSEEAAARVRQWLARKLDPATYEAAHHLHACLSYVNAAMYDERYSEGRPMPCCYQSVIDYEATCVTSDARRQASNVRARRVLASTSSGGSDE